MGVAVALQEQDRYRSRIQVAEGYAMAVKRQAQARRSPLNALMMELRRMLLTILKSGSHIRVSLRKLLQENQDAYEERELQSLLWRLRDNAEGLRTIVGYRASLLRARPNVIVFWSPDIHDKLLEQVEDLEDLTETLALGLCPDVRAEIMHCRSESGLSDAVAPA